MLQWSASDPFHHQILGPIVAHAWSIPFVFLRGRGKRWTWPNIHHSPLWLPHPVPPYCPTAVDSQNLSLIFWGRQNAGLQIYWAKPAKYTKNIQKKMSAWGTGGESALLQQRTHGGKLTRWDWLNVFFIRTVREWQCGFPIMWHTFCCRLLRRVHNA